MQERCYAGCPLSDSCAIGSCISSSYCLGLQLCACIHKLLEAVQLHEMLSGLTGIALSSADTVHHATP
jgi:hypothetical protein